MITSALLLQAYIIGWTVAAPIGPVNLEIIRRSLRHRLLAGFLVGVGATMIDTMYLLLTGFGLASALQKKPVLLTSLVLGGGLMGWLAWMALVEAWREWHKMHEAPGEHDPLTEHAASDDLGSGETPPPAKRVTLVRSWLVGLGMTASNPMTLVFWATLPSLLFGAGKPATPVVLVAALAVWAGTLSWVGTLMAVLAFARRWVGPRLFAVASGLGGLGMGYFALRFLWMAAHIGEFMEKMANGVQ
ncbi:LysE family transporter [bacterium]|nr:LysE family transporter [bacterium]